MTRIKVLSIALFVLFAATAYFNKPYSAKAAEPSEAPAAPTGVTASDSAFITKISLRWDTIRGATLYRIYRNTTNNSGSATDIGTTAANFFADENCVANINY